MDTHLGPVLTGIPMDVKVILVGVGGRGRWPGPLPLETPHPATSGRSGPFSSLSNGRVDG